MRAALLATVLLAAAPAWAVNKCTGADGKVTFQDTPCTGEKAETVKIFKSDPQPPSVRHNAVTLCEEGIRASQNWKDPDSLKISDVARIGFTTITLHDARTMVVQYRANVNGKNSYGGYTGNKLAICYLDQTETRLLRVLAPG